MWQESAAFLLYKETKVRTSRIPVIRIIAGTASIGREGNRRQKLKGTGMWQESAAFLLYKETKVI